MTTHRSNDALVLLGLKQCLRCCGWFSWPPFTDILCNLRKTDMCRMSSRYEERHYGNHKTRTEGIGNVPLRELKADQVSSLNNLCRNSLLSSRAGSVRSGGGTINNLVEKHQWFVFRALLLFQNTCGLQRVPENLNVSVRTRPGTLSGARRSGERVVSGGCPLTLYFSKRFGGMSC